MIKIRRQFTFLLTGILSLQSVFALDVNRFPGDILPKAFEQLLVILQNQWIRAGISIIALVWLFYAMYSALIKKITIFSENSKTISIPLAVLSSLGILWKVKIELISNLFMFFAAAIIVIYIIKGFLFLSKKMGGTYNPQKAIRDEKRVIKEAKQSEDLENRILSNENKLEKEIKEESYDIEKMKKFLEALKKSAEAGQGDVKKIFSDTKRD